MKLSEQLLGVSDLAKRWNYKTVHGVRKRQKYDRKFPKPIAVINKRVLVFLLSDIETYENLRGGIGIHKKRYQFYETQEEWQTKSRAEREKQRGFKYTTEEWELEENKLKQTLPKGNV